MAAKTLTVKSIEALKGETLRRELPDGLLPGLYLVIQPSGVKTWAVRYRAQGRPKKLTLGRWPGIDLASARELARVTLRSAAEGNDPAAEKQTERRMANDATKDRDLVASVVGEFLQRHVAANNRPSTAKETERLLRQNVLPAWGKRHVQDISKRDVLDLLDEIVDRGAAISANRTLAALRKMFNWGIDRDIIQASPCDRVRAPASERSRDRVLSDAELRLIWCGCEKIGWPFGPMFQLLLLTAQRRGEVAGMRWSEVDFSERMWTIPKERSKNGRAHVVPLSDAVVAILNAVPRVGSKYEYVFTTNGQTFATGYSRAKKRIDQAISVAQVSEDGHPPAGLEQWTIHDFRRTAATGMARSGTALPVIEKVLNHSSGSFAGVVGVYQRHSYVDEKRNALETWTAELMRITNS